MSYSHNPRALILGLLSCCPFKECDRDCPLAKVRSEQIPKKQKLAFSRFTDAQVEGIINYHDYCSKRRDNPFAKEVLEPIARPPLSSAEDWPLTVS